MENDIISLNKSSLALKSPALKVFLKKYGLNSYANFARLLKLYSFLEKEGGSLQLCEVTLIILKIKLKISGNKLPKFLENLDKHNFINIKDNKIYLTNSGSFIK